MTVFPNRRALESNGCDQWRSRWPTSSKRGVHDRGPSESRARDTGLSATLGSDQEIPPTTHAGTATATISNYSVTTQTFDITVAVSNFLPGDATGFHIHQGAVGVNGPIIVDFTGVAPLLPVGTGFTFTARA